MNPTARDRRGTLPSIHTVYQPIETFWNSFDRREAIDRDLERVLNPLDAFLTHLILELAPGLPVLVDLAAEATMGTSSLIGLTHPHVSRVVVADGGTLDADRSISALRVHLRSQPKGPAPLDIIPRAELPASLSGQTQVVILADAREGRAEELANGIRLWLDERPDALVLVLGLARVGECPAIESLLRISTTDSGRRFWLLREVEDVLADSGLGMIARNDHPHAEEILQRIQLFHTSNYRYLDLLKSVSQAAMHAARADDEVMHSHPYSASVRAEVDSLRRAAQESRAHSQESKAQADAANQSLAVMEAELNRLRHAVHETWQHADATAQALAHAHHQLATRLSTRVWRKARRIARKCLPRSR